MRQTGLPSRLYISYFRKPLIWSILDYILLLMIFPLWCVTLCLSAHRHRNSKMCLSRFVPIRKLVCLNNKTYLSKSLNVFVPSVKCIGSNCKTYLSWLQNIFAPTAKCICPDCKSMIFPLSGVCPCVLELYRHRKGSSRKLLMLGSKVHGQVAKDKTK